MEYILGFEAAVVIVLTIIIILILYLILQCRLDYLVPSTKIQLVWKDT